MFTDEIDDSFGALAVGQFHDRVMLVAVDQHAFVSAKFDGVLQGIGRFLDNDRHRVGESVRRDGVHHK